MSRSGNQTSAAYRSLLQQLTAKAMDENLASEEGQSLMRPDLNVVSVQAPMKPPDASPTLTSARFQNFSPSRLAEAVVMAEVLDRPLALRRGRKFRR